MIGSRESVFAIDWRPEARLPRALFSAIRPALESATGIAELSRRYAGRPRGLSAQEFLGWTLGIVDSRLEVAPSDLARVPRTGPAVVVSNHPFGAIEGVALAKAMLAARPDVRVLANFILRRIPEIAELFLLVDPFGGSAAASSNRAGLRAALDWLRQGGLLVVFPAGEVASFDRRARRVADPAWSPTVAGLIRRSDATAVPVFIPGRNGLPFQVAGLLHPLLRTALLPRQLLAGRTVEVRVGSPIPAARLADLADDAAAIRFLRDRSEILAAREVTHDDRAAVQPRRTPPRSERIVPAVPPDELAAEIARLPESSLLVSSEEMRVHVASAEEIPNVLREIGRLREVTFREVGEGTGREIDLDGFDRTYLHLFIWKRDSREIIGAYRLGLTDRVIQDHGIEGLYTSTLFRFDRHLFEAMGPALEMGRSWIRVEHQRSYVGLMLLWKGIGEFVSRHPRYATLFGPVSISAGYQALSQRLIIAFLDRNRKLTDWARWVRPTNPFRGGKRRGLRARTERLSDLEEVSSLISEIEHDQKGVPILLKQYLKLDGRILGCNVDPDFSNVLDVLIVVDLRLTDRRVLGRYMGRDGVEKLHAFHARHDPETRAG
ncbi:MAG TPA: GNAT family N-acyltransferase [Candidatus Sulfotelmatobacter sp.]|jgi:putative hemolysin|nr:GNAT family N-acyltransferase [Candidatus Sulfotelmatobacter sp.]